MKTLPQMTFKLLKCCPVCSSERLSPYSKVSKNSFTLSYVRCLDCTFVFMNPQTTQDCLENIFSSNAYWEGDICYADYSLLEKTTYLTARLRLKYLSRFLPPGASILEVGCASGQFLGICKDAGYDVTGIDISTYKITNDLSQSSYKELNIINTNFDDYIRKYLNNKFDAVCLWAIEGNFPDLANTFLQIRQLLYPNGLCALNWINFDHWLRPFLFGSFRQGITALSNLTQHSFRILQKKTGFQQIFSAPDYQYANLEKFCALSGHKRLLKLARRLKISRLAIPLPTILGKLSILQKRDKAD